MANCIFCAIVAGQAPASVVHRDDLCTAFLTIQPAVEGHTLVVPNRHSRGLADLGADVAGHLVMVAQRISGAFAAAGVQREGTNLFLAEEAAAGQTVFHTHLHVIPRHALDGFGWKVPESFHTLPPRERLDEIAARLSAVVQR